MIEGFTDAIGWSGNLPRWWYVLRYYRKRQLAARLAGVARRWMRRCGALHAPCVPGLVDAAPGLRANRAIKTWARQRIAERDAAKAGETARRVLEGRFRFLNEERVLPDPVDWALASQPDTTRLWRFALHYHEFLLDLAAEGLRTGEAAPLRRAWDLVAQWIDANQADDSRAFDDAWHPYCISRRLPAWIALWAVCGYGSEEPSYGGLWGEMADRVLRSMAAQAGFLERNLEWDLRGNHLIENLRALVLAGAFLDGPDADRWLDRGLSLLRHELAEQVLPHGEHFERSPMYHARMLEALLDVRDVAEPHLAVDRMASFLGAIVHPDGEIPLLGDSCFGETAPTAQILARASSSLPAPRSPLPAPCSLPPAPRSLPPAPYWSFRDGGDFLLFDAGPVGADHLPAHAHADLLAIEASWNGRRLFVDSGVFDYEDGPMRRYCRSTAAHNCLEIDGQDQCDMWSRFRMGYRGWPGPLEAGQCDGFHWARAWHNAYRRLGVPRVGRHVACRSGGPWLVVDWAEGRGRHELTNRLHLHPDATVAKTADGELQVDHAGRRLRLVFLTPGEVAIEAGWYCPEFGLRLPAPVICWKAAQDLPAVCAWSLVWGDSSGEGSLEGGPGDGLALVWREGDRQVRLRPIGG
jgi:uncharacterized heparinase superfamily protein